MEKLLNKSVHYTDWDIMMERTSLDIEFLEAFSIKYEYRILVNKDRKITVEFTCKNC